MATRSLGSLTLDLIARSGGFVEGMTKAEREAAQKSARIKGSLEKITKEAEALGKRAAVAFGAMVTGIAAAGVAMYRSGAQSVAALVDMSDQIGIATDDLGGLRFAAQQMSGMADTTFDVSLRRMTRRITEAADGAGPAVSALKSLRLEASDLAKMSPDEQFRAIADAMSGISSQGEKLRTTMAIFDTEGVPLVNTLSQGSEAIEAMESRARELGLTIDRIDAAKVDAANKAMEASAATMGAFSQHIAVQFAPIIQSATDYITGMSGEIGSMETVAERVFNNVIEGAAFLADAADGVSRVFRIMSATVIGTFATMVNKIIGGIDTILYGYQLLAETFGMDAVAGGIEGLRQFGQLSGDIAREAAADIDRILMEEMAGTKFKRFVAEAQATGEAAARALVDGMAVLGAAGAEAPAKEDEAAAKRLETLRESFYTEEQMLGAKYVREQEMLREALTEGQLIQDEYDALALSSQEKYEEALTAIKKKGEQARIAAVGGALSTISTLMNGESRKLFEIGKVAAIANATISMYEGVMRAWALGPILGPILAPLVAAAGVMNIRGIMSTKFGGGSAGVSNTQSINNAGTGVEAAPAQRNVYLHGIDPGSLYSGSQLLDVLNNELVNGGRLMGVAA